MITDKEYFSQFFNTDTGKERYQQLRKDAERFTEANSIGDSLEAATRWYADETYYIQMWAVYVMGYIASQNPDVMRFLKETVSGNPSWQVQECLGVAFDSYCKATGYEASLPVIREWLGSGTANVRRAVTEGLRIWTGRPFFKEHPGVAVDMLSALKNDKSEYVRKSVGNALRDISKKHSGLVKAELDTWILDSKGIAQVYY